MALLPGTHIPSYIAGLILLAAAPCTSNAEPFSLLKGSTGATNGNRLHQAGGLVKVPCSSVIVSGNWDAWSTPVRIGLMKSMWGRRARLGFLCGLRIPTVLPN